MHRPFEAQQSRLNFLRRDAPWRALAPGGFVIVILLLLQSRLILEEKRNIEKLATNWQLPTGNENIGDVVSDIQPHHRRSLKQVFSLMQQHINLGVLETEIQVSGQEAEAHTAGVLTQFNVQVEFVGVQGSVPDRITSFVSELFCKLGKKCSG